MTLVKEPSAVDVLESADQVPVYDASNDDTRKASMEVIAAYVAANLGTELAAIASLTAFADSVPYFTGPETASLAPFTAFGRSLVGDEDAATARTTLGLVIGTQVQAYDPELAAIAGLTSAASKGIMFPGPGTAATYNLTPAALTLLDDADVAAMRTTLGLAIGVDVQAYDAELAAIAGLTSAANKLPYFTGAATAAVTDLTAFARTLLDDPDAATALTTLGAQSADAELTAIAGLTSAANKVPYHGIRTAALADLSAFGRSLIDDADATAGRATLGLVIGTNVQAQDAELSAIAGLTSAADKAPYFTGSGTAALMDVTAFARTLLDDANAAAALATLGVSSAAVVAGVAQNLKVVSAGGNSATITADGIIVYDGSTYVALTSVNVAPSCATAGSAANGRDQAGAFANNTWIYGWVIWNGTTAAGLWSTSATAPTMPSGYTHKALVTAFYTAGGTNIARPYQQVGRKVYYAAGVSPDLSGSQTASFASVDLKAKAPPLARFVILNVIHVPAAADGYVSLSFDGGNEFVRHASPVAGRGAGYYQVEMPCDSGQLIYYQNSAGSGTTNIVCNGWMW